MGTLIPKWHRAYLRSHPVGLMVSLGIFLAGALALFAPAVVEREAASAVLPTWALTLFNVVWFTGGGAAFVGMLLGIRRLHVPGMALIAGGLLSYYAVLVSLLGLRALAAVFIALLGVGCAAHAWNLARFGYEGTAPR